MNEVKITIITPSYNRAHTLTRVYNSLKNQTFRDFKWIIMDDGSTDNTKEIVDNFKSEGLIAVEYFWNHNQHKFIKSNIAIFYDCRFGRFLPDRFFTNFV